MVIGEHDEGLLAAHEPGRLAMRQSLHDLRQRHAEASQAFQGGGRRIRRIEGHHEVAEGEGFEPPVSCPTAVFKTAALNRSATPPLSIIRAVPGASKIMRRLREGHEVMRCGTIRTRRAPARSYRRRSPWRRPEYAPLHRGCPRRQGGRTPAPRPTRATAGRPY